MDYELTFWQLGARNLSGSRVPWVTTVMEQTLIPTVYAPGSLAFRIVDALAEEIGQAWDAVDFMEDQSFAATASANLPAFEVLFGLGTDLSTDLITRQQAVLARMRAGASPTLPAYRAIGQVADQGDLHPIVDPLANELYIQFIGQEGMPATLGAVQAALGIEAAARLGITYLFRYAVWDNVDTWDPTWDHIDALVDPVTGAGGYTWDSWDALNPNAFP